jgi:hypothetical protein
MEFLKMTENHGSSDKNTDFIEKHGKHGFRVFMFSSVPTNVVLSDEKSFMANLVGFGYLKKFLILL